MEIIEISIEVNKRLCPPQDCTCGRAAPLTAADRRDRARQKEKMKIN